MTREFNEENIVLSTNDAGTIGYPHAKIKKRTLLTPYKKVI